MSGFDAAFAVLVGHEGGYDTDRRDAGNWTGGRVGAGALRGTRFGISAAAYPKLDIAALTLADARALYRRDYWNRVAADRLASPLALVMFDAAVNNGPRRAGRWLQEIVGATQDGIVGPLTLDAVRDYVAIHGVTALCARCLASRVVFMAGLPSWPAFAHGWARRLCTLPYQSLTFTQEAS